MSYPDRRAGSSDVRCLRKRNGRALERRFHETPPIVIAMGPLITLLDQLKAHLSSEIDTDIARGIAA